MSTKRCDCVLKFSEFESENGEKISFDLIEKVLEVNNRYRKNYDLDEREKVNNIKFGDDNERDGQTEEELKDQNDRSSVGE